MDILSGSVEGKAHLFRRKPNGSYAAGETLKHASGKPINLGGGSSVAAVDWDGDGDLDLVIGNSEGAVYLVPNDGTKQKPVFDQASRLKAGERNIVAEGGAAGPFFADWDGDGLPDLILGSGSGKVVWCRNVGSKGKTTLGPPANLVDAPPTMRGDNAAEAENPKRSGSNSKVCVADWNGDGRPDLLVGDYIYVRKGDRGILHGWVWLYPRTGELEKKPLGQ
jgi:hypothetical protein